MSSRQTGSDCTPFSLDPAPPTSSLNLRTPHSTHRAYLGHTHSANMVESLVLSLLLLALFRPVAVLVDCDEAARDSNTDVVRRELELGQMERAKKIQGEGAGWGARVLDSSACLLLAVTVIGISGLE